MVEEEEVYIEIIGDFKIDEYITIKKFVEETIIGNYIDISAKKVEDVAPGKKYFSPKLEIEKFLGRNLLSLVATNMYGEKEEIGYPAAVFNKNGQHLYYVGSSISSNFMLWNGKERVPVGKDALFSELKEKGIIKAKKVKFARDGSGPTIMFLVKFKNCFGYPDSVHINTFFVKECTTLGKFEELFGE